METYVWRILLVDDDEDDYFLTRTMLAESRHGKFSLEWASSFEKGRAALHESEFDAVLVDYDMGARSGIELIREETAEGCLAPMILLTGRGTYDVDVEAMQAGAADYLNKSEINPAFLERSIRYAIERRRSQLALAEANDALEAANTALAETNHTLFETNASLQASRQELSEILQSIGDKFLVLDRSWRLIYINQYAASESGFTPEQIIGKNIWETFPTMKNTIVWEKYRQVMETRQPASFQIGQEIDPNHMFDISVYPFAQGISVFWRDVTQQRQAEEALQRQRALLQKLFDSIPVMIIIYDASSRVLSTNPEFTRLTGWKAEDLLEGDLLAMLSPDSIYREELYRFIHARQEGWQDLFITCKDGSQVESSWILLRLTDGSRLVIGIDIRERKRAEAALMAANTLLNEQKTALEIRNQNLEILFDNAPTAVALFEARPPYHMLSHNPQYQQPFPDPYRNQGMRGLPIQEFLPNAEESGILAVFNEVAETSKPRILSGFPLDGLPEGRTWWNWTLTPLNVEGKIQALVYMAVNVTSEWKSRELIEKERAFLQTVLEQMPAGVVIAEAPSGRLLMGNKLMESIWRQPFVAAENMQEYSSVYHGFHSTGRAYRPEEWPMSRALNKGEVVRDQEIRIQRGDGTFGTVLISATPIRTVGGKITAASAIILDVTERKRAEEDQLFLIALGEILNRTDDPDELLSTVTEMTARHLDVTRCIFTDIHPAERKAGFRAGYHRQDAPFTGYIDLDSFDPRVTGSLENGRTVIVRDTQSDPRTAPAYERMFGPRGLRSYLAVPLMRGEVWSATLILADNRPRNWNERQVAFMQIVAERAWAAYEIRDMVGALRQNEMRAQRLAEEAHINLQKLETIIDSMSEGVMLSDPSGTIVRINPAAVALHGYGSEEEMKRSIGEIFTLFETRTPDGQRVSLEEWSLSRALKGETVINFEAEVLRSDTGRSWIGLYSSIPIRDARGEIILVLTTITNITQVRQAEKHQREMDTRLEVQRMLVEQREQERLQIARDLHDGPIQELIGLMFTLQTARRAAGSEELPELLIGASQEAEKLVSELRGVCNNLRPPMLEKFGLAKAIQAHIDDLLARRSPIEFRLDLDNDQDVLDHESRLAFYRIYQESLNNILRHAHASRIDVRLEIAPTRVVLVIEDNGSGFMLPNDLLSLAREGHLGLVGIKERADAIGAALQITSAPGAGTRIQVMLLRDL